MSFEINFSGKVVLITGATRGIGAAIARDFNAAGADLILTGTNQDKIDKLNQETKANKIDNIQYMQVDFSDEDSSDAFLEKISVFDRIDVCVNNAGINRIDLIEETKLEDYNDITMVNLRAPFMLCRQLSKRMKQAKYGRIVNIASIWSVNTKTKRSIYTITKFGIVGLTMTLAAEMAPYNILVNAVSPGFTMTELTTTTNTEEELIDIAENIPIKRLAQPEEISRVVLFLASDLNTYLTGQNIVVDGGFTVV